MVIMIMMLAVIIGSLMMKEFASKLLPLVFASAVLVLAMVEFLRELRRASESRKVVADDDTGIRKEVSEKWQGYLVHGGWLVGFALAIYLLGFLIAVPIFLVAYMRRLGNGWGTTIVVAIVTTGSLYGLFEILLKVVLYRGLLLT